MDISSRTYEDASPSFTSALRPPTPSYPTTPQSCPHTDIMSMNSPSPTGLGLLTYTTQSSNAQLAMCSPPESLIPPSPVWQHANNCFTGPPSDFAGYPTLAFYQDIHPHPVPTTSAPHHSIPSAHSDATSSFGFLSPAQTVKRHSSPIPQHNSTTHNINPEYRLPSGHGQSPVVVKQEPEQNWDRITIGGGVGRSLVEDFPFPLQNFGARGPSRQNRADDDMLLGVPSMMDRDVDRQQSSRSLISAARADRSGTSSIQASSRGRATKKPQCLPNGKYECDQCGKQFTRSSNCRSHMKIHDPNRKYPHKCTVARCTKEFTRKTDLIRHIDSVHRKLRKFGCDQCGYYFARQDTLRRHREDGCRRRQQQHDPQRELPTTSAVSDAVSGGTMMAYPANSSTYQRNTTLETHQPQLASSHLANAYVDSNAPGAYSEFPGY